MKFRYVFGFSVSLELTLGGYSLDQANISNLFFLNFFQAAELQSGFLC